MNWIHEILMAIGGGSVVAVALLIFARERIGSAIDQSIKHTFDEKLESKKNTLKKSEIAFEYILKKEMEFYEKVELHLAELITLIQDIASYAKENEEISDKEEFRSHYLRYLELIPIIKGISLQYQTYISHEMFMSFVGLVIMLQDDMDFWMGILKNAFKGTCINEIENAEVDNKEEQVLKQIEKCEKMIMNRLTEMVNGES